MAKGYLIAESKISDPAAFAAYRQLAEQAIEDFGGRYLIDGGQAEILEGKWTPPQAMLVVEFDSVDQARLFYHSDRYQAARQRRTDAGETHMLLMAGVDNLV